MFSLSQFCSSFVFAIMAAVPLQAVTADFKIESPTAKITPDIPVGKSLVVPISVTKLDGSPYVGSALTYKVTSSNASVPARVKTGNPVLRLHVKYQGSPAFEGDMDLQLFRDLAPITVGNIAGFAQSGYYDNQIFHRVIAGFVAQAGDPTGTGAGGPGFEFEHEFQPSLVFSGKGQLAMANSGGGYNRGVTNASTSQVPAGQIGLGDFSATNGSQFFITQGDQRKATSPGQLDFKHTIFGQLIRGWDLLAKIDAVPVNGAGKPNTDVQIVTAKILPGRAEATVLIASRGVGPSTVTVTATDEAGAAAVATFTATAKRDTVDDRPIMGLLPTTYLDVLQAPDLFVNAVDLEKDRTSFGVAGVRQSNNSVGILPNFIGTATISGGFAGFADPGVYTVAFGVTGIPESTANVIPQVGSEFAPYDSFSWTTQRFIVGKRSVRTEPVTVDATAAAAGTFVVARFTDTDPANSPALYSAKIIWGDGSVSNGSGLFDGTVARDVSRPGPGLFTVSGTHTYARPGVYAATVIVVWNVPNGTPDEIARVRSPVAVAAAGAVLRADGEQVEVIGSTGAAANRILATFTDTNKTRAVSDYQATVDWGDGVIAPATLLKSGPGRFSVRASHTFHDAESFAQNVRIHAKAAPDESSDAVAWSTVSLTGFKSAPHAPPFPITNIRASWDDLNPNRYLDQTIQKVVTGGEVAPYVPANLTAQLRGRLSVNNSGDRASAGSTIRAYLSDDPVLNGPGTPPDLRLKINGFDQITVGALGAGTNLNTGTTPWIVNLPKGSTGAGKYFITESVFSDAIIDQSAVLKYTVIRIPAKILKLGPSLTNNFTTQDGLTKVTFMVALDAAPSFTVTVPVTSLQTAQGTVSPTQLVFTAANYSTPQMVTVTGVNDNNPDIQSYTVIVGPAASNDPLYSGLTGFSQTLTNRP